MGNARFKLPYFAALLLLISPLAVAAGGGYKINPGDVLKIFVWNEAALSGEVIVRPDGIVSVPMAGHIQAGGEAPEDVEKVLAKNLSKYLKDEPVVTVSRRPFRAARTNQGLGFGCSFRRQDDRH